MEGLKRYYSNSTSCIFKDLYSGSIIVYLPSLYNEQNNKHKILLPYAGITLCLGLNTIWLGLKFALTMKTFHFGDVKAILTAPHLNPAYRV